jgi:hypothetical protein
MLQYMYYGYDGAMMITFAAALQKAGYRAELDPPTCAGDCFIVRANVRVRVDGDACADREEGAY